jgi:beta-lactamase regulating signal transducer with metallopeptidase domain
MSLYGGIVRMIDLSGFWADLWWQTLLKGSALLLAAGLLSLALPRASAAMRHLLWTLAVIGLLGLPLFVSSLPAWEMAMPSWLAAAAAHEAAASVLDPVLPSEAPADRGHAGRGLETLLRADVWLFGLWQAGLLLVLAVFAGCALRLRGLIRRSWTVTDPGWLGLRDSLSRELGIDEPVRLLQNDGLGSPLVLGFRRHLILIPQRCDAWSESQRRNVLLHELAHVQRRDCLTQWIAMLACALHWYNPLVWLAAGRMRLERERSCDDLVLLAGARASSYAQQLLDLARSLGTGRRIADAGLALARRSLISNRLSSLLDMRRHRGRLDRSRIVAIACLVALLVMALSAFRPVAASRGGADQRVRPDSLARLQFGQLDADLDLYGVPAEQLAAALDKVAGLDSREQRRRAFEQLGLRALTIEEFGALLDTWIARGSDFRVARPLTLADLRGPDGKITARSLIAALQGIAADDEGERIPAPVP